MDIDEYLTAHDVLINEGEPLSTEVYCGLCGREFVIEQGVALCHHGLDEAAWKRTFTIEPESHA